MSFALLGDIAFDLITAPTSFDEKRSASFVEHAVLSGKPRLQAMGDDLTEITLQLRLHYQLAPVEPRYQALINAKEKQAPLALVLGLSQFKGHFVISELSSQTLFSDANGNALAREVSLTLREFIGNTAQGVLGTALSVGGNSPLASFIPQSLTNFVGKATQLVSKGVKAYRQARQAIIAVREAVTTMKSLSHSPLEAMKALPALLQHLEKSTSGLAEMVGLQHAFSQCTQGLRGAEPFLNNMVALSEQLTAVQQAFKQGLNAQEFGGWFDLGVKAVENADEVAQAMAHSTAQLTAWLAVRGDTPTTPQEQMQWTV